MKKVLLSLVALMLTFNTVNAEVLEDNKVTVTTIDELQEAINNANDGDTITLGANVSGSIEITKSIIIDLNQYSINANGTKTIIVIKNIDKPVTIKNGYLKGANVNAEGGAVNIISNSDVIIDNITFENNSATSGGAIKISAGNLTIKDSKFIKNSSLRGTGGAIHAAGNNGNTVVSIENTLFEENEAAFGGAIQVSSSNKETSAKLVLKSNVRFINNSAKSYGGAVRSSGSNTELEIFGATFKGNKANGGGAINISHSAKDNEEIVIKNTLFEENEASIGGAIYIIPTANDLDVTTNEVIVFDETVKIINNKANAGGGIYVVAGANCVKAKLIVRATIYNNSAKNMADDIYVAAKRTIGTNDTVLVLSEVDGNNMLDCEHGIDGWYIDAKGSRWNVHDLENFYVEEVDGLELTGAQSLKAAHDVFGKLIIKYVDIDGNELADEIVSSKKIGTEYSTSKIDFDGYRLKEVIGDENGTYTTDDITVIYVYEPMGIGGNEDIPDTGIYSNNILEISIIFSAIALIGATILKKKLVK